MWAMVQSNDIIIVQELAEFGNLLGFLNVSWICTGEYFNMELALFYAWMNAHPDGRTRNEESNM